ncbi:MAG: hypothetical protein QM726_04100 [Chitinophagaceae bacterium]
MASIGKKILSAFVEVTAETPAVNKPEEVNNNSTVKATINISRQTVDERFSQYFEKLFKEANLPGPDYYEFAKMIEAMQIIPDERARYSAAFAGLQVQGLDKKKLLDTAAAYLEILQKDESNFLSTVDAAVQEKVLGKQKAMEEQQQRIQQLTEEIAALKQSLETLQDEVKENEEKIAQRTNGYKDALAIMKSRIEQDSEKIKTFIQS